MPPESLLSFLPSASEGLGCWASALPSLCSWTTPLEKEQVKCSGEVCEGASLLLSSPAPLWPDPWDSRWGSQLLIQISKEELSQEGCIGGVLCQGLRPVALCPN